MPRVVFDTVVFVRSLINPNGRWGDLLFARGDRYELVLSEPIVREILEVLNRPELTRKYRTVAQRDMRTILDLLSQASLVEVGDVLPVSRDPKDDKFLATARVAGAEYLVTEDQDLLVLKQSEGTTILTAERFLEILKR